MPTLQEVIHRFDPISLAEMDRVELLDRMDTKYVFGSAQLPELLEMLRPEYRVLEVAGKRGTDYRSLYFDTTDLKHYHEHHNGHSFRSKVRFREYVGSGLSYLEVKRKTGRGGTDTKRIRLDGIPATMTPDQQVFAATASNCNDLLHPQLWNHFTRLTLVHRTRNERLTIDHSLRFTQAGTERSLDGICVAELKEARADRSSPFARLMRTWRVRPAGMSKYCIGMLLLHDRVKRNAFKPILLQLERIRQAA
jgi:hypothetical protein